MTFRPRIRTILLVVNLIILMLPVAGIAGLRIYDNELIRQTEASLLAQGAVLQSAYKNQLLRELAEAQIPYEDYGQQREVAAPPSDGEHGSFPPSLDLTRDQVYGAAEPPTIPPDKPDRFARTAGAHMAPIVNEVQEGTASAVQILDWRGTIVAPGAQTNFVSVGDRTEVARALRGEVVSMLRERGEDRSMSFTESLTRRRPVIVSVAVPIAWGKDRIFGAVTLEKAPLGLGQALYESRSVFAGLLATLILGVSMITLLTTFTIQRPIRQLIRQARRIAATGGAARRIEQPGTLEFQELSEAIATMARTLDERNEYIRTFARDVSHEFKTPLASIKGTVELLEDHFEAMPTEKRQKFLGMIAEDTERLDRLVRRLLELARADVFNPTTEWVDGAELLAELGVRSKVNLHIDFGDQTAMPVAMAPEVFESVFTNLFDNSAQHGGDNVAVELIESRGPYFKILVSDDGEGISQANAEKIFHSFFTTARDEGGTGLGLPIVKSLLQRHGGDIQLTPAEGRGASFLLTIPRAGWTEAAD